MILLFIAGIGMQEIIFILLIVLLFFGGKKIPELMKGIGKGIRSFKDGMNNIGEDIKDGEDTEKITKDKDNKGKDNKE